MPPRKSKADKAREDKSTAPSPSPAASSRSSRQKGKQVAEVQEELAGDGQAEDAVAEEHLPEAVDAAEEVDEASEDVPETEEAEEESEESGKKLTMAERMQKLKDLRTRMVGRLVTRVADRPQTLTG